MKKAVVPVSALAALLLGLTGCAGGKNLLGDNNQPAPGATTPPPTLTAEQEEASKACLSLDEQKVLQAAADSNDKLLAACRQKGQAVYDSLSQANKDQAHTAKLANELKETKEVARATFIVHYLNGIKEKDASGVVVSDREATAQQMRSFFPNATNEDLLIGSTGQGAIDKAKHKVETGGAPFYDGNNVTYLDSTDAIAKWLASDDSKAKAAKERVTAAIKAAGKSDKEVRRAHSGAGYIPVQLKGESQVLGTSYYTPEGIQVMDQWRQSQAGDLYWLFITEDGMLVPDATLRADCGNPGAKQIRIVKVNIPPAVPIGYAPGKEQCPPGTVMQPNGECRVPPPPAPPQPPVNPVCKVNCAPPPPPACQVNCVPLEAKIPSEGSGPQGNAPVGSGRNADPGPGEYKAPAQMEQPPAVQPAPPASPAPRPAPVQQPGGAVIPAPSPNPTPFTPAPEEPGVNPAPAPGATEPPRNSGEVDNPWG